MKRVQTEIYFQTNVELTHTLSHYQHQIKTNINAFGF